MREREDPDPLAPLDFGVTIVSWVVGVVLVLLVIAALLGSGGILGFGGSEVCADTTLGVVPYGGGSSDGSGPHVLGLRKQASADPQIMQVCYRDPSLPLTAGAAIGPAAELGFLLGCLLLTRRLIRSARRNRLFSADIATQTRRLGWFLLGGSVLAAVLQALSDHIVLSASVRDYASSAVLRGKGFDFPLTLILVGLGAITVGRVLERAVAMQDDVDVTI